MVLQGRTEKPIVRRPSRKIWPKQQLKTKLEMYWTCGENKWRLMVQRNTESVANNGENKVRKDEEEMG